MYLRLTQRKNRDGSVVRYVQLAHSRRVNGRPQAEVVANLGREDQLDLAALRRLVASIGRYVDKVDATAQPDADGPARPERPARRSGGGPADPTRPEAPARPAPGWTGPAAGMDRLVGRDRDLVDLPRLLSRHRLVTICGPAGVGKTRLAVEFAHRVAPRYRGRMWWVDLAPVPAGTPVDTAVAAALGAREQPGQGTRTVLADVCGTGPALLVLDNCEHVVDGCADLVTWLLGACPKLRLLATSREGLRVSGEARYPLAPLAVPDDDPLAPTGGVRQVDSVRLFVDRARAVAPGFEPTDQLDTMVGQVCARLDGLPLAIELTARQLTALTLPQVLQRMDDRLSMLTGGSRGAPDRHRSLRAAIGWSYDLLDRREQAAFRRLSLLPGGFDEAGAAAVCADLELSEGDLWALLRALVDKSLMVVEAAPAPRFRILESVRAYGVDQLHHEGEADDTRERLLGWLTELARPLVTEPVVAGDVLARVDHERHNLTLGAHLLDSAGDERYPILAVALAFLARKHGQVAHSRDLLVRTLARYPNPTAARAAVLASLAMTENWAGEYEQARRHAEQSLALARRLGNRPLQERAAQRLALTLTNLGDYSRAVVYSRQVVAGVRAGGDVTVLPIALNDLAWLLVHDDDLPAAAETVDEALSVLSTKDKTVWDDIMHTAGTVALRQGRLGQAAGYFSMALATGVSYAAQVPYNLEGLALAAAAANEHHRALRLFAAASTVRTATQRTADPWWTRLREAAIAGAREHLAPAQAVCATAEGARLTTAEAIRYGLLDEWRAEPRTSPLTRREYQVAELVAEGLTNPQIAARLGVSPRTIVNHLEHIKTKLDVSTRTQIATWTAHQRTPG
jgi:predicted ATPase/DNA-binding CsgD family transcriptional regulator